MVQAISPFQLDEVVEEAPFFEEDGVRYGRSRMEKTFHGDIEGTSSVEMLSVRGEEGSAGYVAIERISGVVQGRSGSFALLHLGTTTTTLQWGRWPIVVGSGTEELAGISGEARIEIGPDGSHLLYLDYELPRS